MVPPPPTEPIARPKPLPDRDLDPRFYRACYEDAAALSDAALLAAAADGDVPPERLRNPFEFIQQVLAQGLLPRDFDPLGYRINHPDLWGRDRADWEAALHFLKHKANGTAPDVASWARPFDPDFHAALYLPHADIAMLRDHHRKHPDAYGSLDEALVRNGWASRDWVIGFDHHAYTVYNSLGEQLATPGQALVHFIEHGWREQLAVSAEAEFDPAYFTDLSGQPLTVSLEEAYRTWVEMGLACQAPANEAAHLRAIGLDLARFPEGFDWRTYLEERPELTDPVVAAEPENPPDPTDPADPAAVGSPAARNRWHALTHLIEHGLLQADMALPVTPDLLPRLLLAAGDRFSIAQREAAAARCYERALLYPDPPLRLLRHAGDQALRHGHHARALAHYRRARALPTPGFWTWCNGARAALAVGEPDEAAACVLGGLADFPRSGRLYDVLLEIQHIRFSQAVARHLGALRAGRARTGLAAALDAIMDLFLAAHRASFGQDAPPPRPAGPRPAGDGTLRVVVLANRDLPQCAFYRVDLKVLQVAAAGGAELQVYVPGEEDDFRCAAATADVALFYRVAAGVEVLRSIAACRGMGVLTVYEIDDLVFDPAAFPEPLAAYDGAIDAAEHLGLRAGVDLVRFAASACDAAIASTEALAAPLRALVRSGVCHVHRNGLSGALATFARAATPRPKPPNDTPVTLFYASYTRAHGADFRDLLQPALARLMAERAEVRVIICGHVDAAALAHRFPGRVERIEPIDDRDAFLSQLLGVDINLAVLRPGPFNDCKSEIKWLEAAAFCVPSVVSDVAGYRETLIDGVHVVRVGPDPAAWYTALKALVVDPAGRAAIGAAARDRALELYGPRPLGHALVTALRGMTRQGANPLPAGVDAPRGKPRRPVAGAAAPTPTVAAAPRRARILLANVFFPPQAIGGATRVVRDQAAELMARYADRYDIGILCGNDEDSPPYRIEAYAWSGAPVWSIGCPRREHTDWLAFDPRMAAPVDAVLDRFQPDLVHAHCIQRLTATALERVAARGIPYVVTAHDAWWVSDHQFLVDQQHRLRMPWDSEAYETAQNPHTRAESWSRRLRLRGVLDAAAAVLAVSRAFADIYQRAGIARAVPLPNGLPELPPLEPVPPAPGRVRLAHVGGVVPHKGYYLLRQALARGCYRNLEMLVADHAVLPGEERTEVWGTTPVSVIGRVPQDRVGALYGRIDVLCAPSLWPESYGLVAREALHYGKWVIASNRGAIGEDVVPGRNGWVIDVADPAALPRVLAEIDANADRYTRPSESDRPARGVADQVDDIVSIYKRVLQAWP